MAQQVFVTGGSGFVGRAVISDLVSRGRNVHALVNRKPIDGYGDRVTSYAGGLFDRKALDAAMADCDAVIHLVGIIMERRSAGITFGRMHVEGTRAVVDAARRKGVRRYIQMSALGSRPGAASEYHKTKYAAEELVRASGLPWTIFRPSLIHGADGEFVAMEKKWARHQAPPFFFMPYFGAGPMGLGGAGKLQPVYVKDVARAFVDAIEKPSSVGEVYPLVGPDVVTWPQMHQIMARAFTGTKQLVLPFPVWAAKFYAAIGVAPLLGFNRDQVVMSQEGNTSDPSKVTAEFGWQPAPFESTVQEYAKDVR